MNEGEKKSPGLVPGGRVAKHFHSFCYIFIACENVANPQTRSKKCDETLKSRWKNYGEALKSRWKNVFLSSDNTSYYVEKED